MILFLVQYPGFCAAQCSCPPGSSTKASFLPTPEIQGGTSRRFLETQNPIKWALMGLRSLPLGPQFKLSGSSDSLCFGKLEELPEKHFKDIGTHLLPEHSPSAKLTSYPKSTATAASAARRRTTFHRSPSWCAGSEFSKSYVGVARCASAVCRWGLRDSSDMAGVGAVSRLLRGQRLALTGAVSQCHGIAGTRSTPEPSVLLIPRTHPNWAGAGKVQ